MSPNKRHLHKYNRIRTRAKFKRAGRFANIMIKEGQLLYACVLPDCTHTTPVDSARLLIGKIALCSKCNTPFVMTKESILLAKPHCVDCKKVTPKTEQIKILDELLDNL